MLFQPLVKKLVRHLNSKCVVLKPDGPYWLKPRLETLSVNVSPDNMQAAIPYCYAILYHSPKLVGSLINKVSVPVLFGFYSISELGSDSE